MPLVTSNQYDLVPQFSNIGKGAALGMQMGSQFRANRLEDDRLATEKAKQGRISQFSPDALNGDRDALAEIAKDDPKRALDIQKIFQGQSEADIAEGLRENKVLTQAALDAQSLAPEKRRPYLMQKQQEWKAAGRDTSNIDRALAGDDAAMNQAIELQARQGLEIDEQAKALFPGAPKQTSLQKNLNAAGLKEGTPEYQKAVLDNINKPSTTINMGGQGKFKEAVQKANAATYSRVTEESDAAIDANQSLEIMENIDVNSDMLEPMKQGIAAFGAAFGIDTSGLANVAGGEAFNAEAQRIVLSVKASQKGPQTDRDEATIRQTVASLGNTPEGNTFILRSARALNERKIERKQFYDDYIQKNGGKFSDDKGKTADSAWAEYKRGVPMVSSKLRTPEGLPVFYYRFEQRLKEANPEATREQILNAWKDADKRKK